MKNIVIYTTPTCHYCHAAKEYFAENNIPYTEYDVSADPKKRQEMVEKSGQMGVPVILVDNDIMVGFQEGTMAHLLGI